MTYCTRASSILRSLSSGCEKAIRRPDATLGSKLFNGLLLVVLAASHDRLHVPLPTGTRWRTPADENQSPVSIPCVPRRKFVGGVVAFDRPRIVDSTGV